MCLVYSISYHKLLIGYSISYFGLNNNTVKSAPDTCFLRRITENPNYLDAIQARFDFTGTEILISETVVFEMEKQGLSVEQITAKFMQRLGANVTVSDMTTDDYILTKELASKFGTEIHWPDNIILAFAIKRDATLISCDKKLISVCRNHVSHDCINPDQIGTNMFNLLQNHLPIPKILKRKFVWGTLQ